MALPPRKKRRGDDLLTFRESVEQLPQKERDALLMSLFAHPRIALANRTEHKKWPHQMLLRTSQAQDVPLRLDHNEQPSSSSSSGAAQDPGLSFALMESVEMRILEIQQDIDLLLLSDTLPPRHNFIKALWYVADMVDACNAIRNARGATVRGHAFWAVWDSLLFYLLIYHTTAMTRFVPDIHSLSRHEVAVMLTNAFLYPSMKKPRLESSAASAPPAAQLTPALAALSTTQLTPALAVLSATQLAELQAAHAKTTQIMTAEKRIGYLDIQAQIMQLDIQMEQQKAKLQAAKLRSAQQLAPPPQAVIPSKPPTAIPKPSSLLVAQQQQQQQQQQQPMTPYEQQRHETRKQRIAYITDRMKMLLANKPTYDAFIRSFNSLCTTEDSKSGPYTQTRISATLLPSTATACAAWHLLSTIISDTHPVEYKSFSEVMFTNVVNKVIALDGKWSVGDMEDYWLGKYRDDVSKNVDPLVFGLLFKLPPQVAEVQYVADKLNANIFGLQQHLNNCYMNTAVQVMTCHPRLRQMLIAVTDRDVCAQRVGFRKFCEGVNEYLVARMLREEKPAEEEEEEEEEPPKALAIFGRDLDLTADAPSGSGFERGQQDDPIALVVEFMSDIVPWSNSSTLTSAIYRRLQAMPTQLAKRAALAIRDPWQAAYEAMGLEKEVNFFEKTSEWSSPSVGRWAFWATETKDLSGWIAKLYANLKSMPYLPPVIFIALRRYTRNATTGNMQKNTRPIHPTKLSFTTENKQRYVLSGLAVHRAGTSKSLEAGHYVAHILKHENDLTTRLDSPYMLLNDGLIEASSIYGIAGDADDVHMTESRTKKTTQGQVAKNWVLACYVLAQPAPPEV